MTAETNNDLTKTLAELIAGRIRDNASALKAMWDNDQPFHYFYLDNLLPTEYTSQIKPNLPKADSLLFRSSLRERKRVGIDFKDHHPILKAALFAFQDEKVLAEVAKITGIKSLEADPSLYASGISVMGKGDFLNPHLDNSHDGDQKLYRSLNLLFYVSEGWKKENGGNFELWDPEVLHPTEIVAAFNRLVVMETHNFSWHSVNKVQIEDTRCCVSNYYFSPVPTRGDQYRHVTTFTGRPEQKVRKLALKADGIARNAAAKAFPSLLNRTDHRLKSEPETTK